MDILNYLENRGLNPKIQGNEAYIYCPVCNKPKLAVNIETGLGHCFVCSAENPSEWTCKTHISKIMEYYKDIVPITPFVGSKKKKEKVNFNVLVDRYHHALLENRKAKKYLVKRGITEESMIRFKLGFAEFKNQGWISIPAFKNDIAELIKYRKVDPDTSPDLDKNQREYGGNSILFNGDALDNFEEVIIVESELDAIATIQAGYENVVGLTCGAGCLKTEWYDDLIMMKRIIIALDNDPPGQNAAKEIFAKRLGVNKCFNVLLPEDTKDPNEFFNKYTKEDFNRLILQSDKFKVENIYSIDEAFDEMYRRSLNANDNVLSLPWDNVNELIGGGIGKTELIVIGASGGTGKTSMAIQIAHHFAKVHRVPSLFFCLEMPVEQLLAKVVLNELDMSYKELKYSDAYIYKMSFKDDLPMYFGYSPTITVDKYYHTVREARNRYGCELFIFDNLQLMVISESPSEYAKAAQAFKNMAMELDIRNILISQPRKMEEDKRFTYNDLFGSVSLSQAPDKILLLERKRGKEEGEGAFVSRTKVIVDKSRFSLGGACFLSYFGDKSNFKEYPKDDIKK